MLSTLLLAPGFQTSVMVIELLWVPSESKWSLYKKGMNI